MAAGTDYLRSVDERTNWSCTNGTFDIFSFHFFSFHFFSVHFFSFDIFLVIILFVGEKVCLYTCYYICIGVSVISVFGDEVHNGIQIRILPRSCSNLVLWILLGFIATSDEDRSRSISRSIRILSWFIRWTFDQDPVQSFPRINIPNL